MTNNVRNTNGNRREDWATPQDLFDKLNKIFNFQIDLAARADNAKCARWIEESDGPDGRGLLTENLIQLVADKGVNPARAWAWCNPPYGPQGCGKVMESIMTLPKSVSLIPAPVGAKWFLKQVWQKADTLVFIHERLQFEGAPGKAMFDSVLVVKGYCTEDQLDALAKIGTVAQLCYTRPWEGPGHDGR